MFCAVHVLSGMMGGCSIPEAEVEKKGSGYVLRADPGVRVSSRAHKMSKSRGNVVNPDDVVTMYGADSLRLYEMFMGPLRDTKVLPNPPCCASVEVSSRLHTIFLSTHLVILRGARGGQLLTFEESYAASEEHGHNSRVSLSCQAGRLGCRLRQTPLLASQNLC